MHMYSNAPPQPKKPDVVWQSMKAWGLMSMATLVFCAHSVSRAAAAVKAQQLRHSPWNLTEVTQPLSRQSNAEGMVAAVAAACAADESSACCAFTHSL